MDTLGNGAEFNWIHLPCVGVARVRVVRCTSDARILIVQPGGEMTNIFGRLAGDLYGQHGKVEVRHRAIMKLPDVGEHLGQKKSLGVSLAQVRI